MENLRIKHWGCPCDGLTDHPCRGSTNTPSLSKPKKLEIGDGDKDHLRKLDRPKSKKFRVLKYTSVAS